MKLFFKKTNKAFTLVETLVAISIFTVSLLGFMSILASSISDISYAKQKILASYLAQEGIEYARNLRDSDVISSTISPQDGWATFRNRSSDISFGDLSDYPNFSRTITKEQVTGTSDEVKITSDVKWTQGSGDRHIIFSENLYNWVE